MEEKHYGGAWVAVAIAIILGILLATGVFGNIGGAVKTVMIVLGIILLVTGLVITGIIVAAIIIASKSQKEDTVLDEKMAVKEIINSKEQEISKLKSYIAVTNIELKRAKKANQSDVVTNYQIAIADAEARLSSLQNEVIDLKSRRDTALGKISEASSIIDGDDKVISDLEKKAQYDKDYADALKELNQ